MAEQIAIAVFFIGVLGMLVLALRKISALANLNIQNQKGILASIMLGVKDKTFKDFSFESFLHALLSKIRVLTLKTEHKISCWLNQLRQKKIEKKNNFPDDYWNKLKK